MRPFSLSLAASLALCAQGARAEIPPSLVHDLKPTIVNLEISVQHGLNAEGTGIRRGTGFIVDAARGVIATNRHLAGTSPARMKVVFEDGRTAEARLWHYDAWHDFAFVRLVEDESLPELQAVRLGESGTLKEQQDVLLIGNNDGEEYSVKFGKTANLHLCKGKRHTATIQTTFDRAGGSSGSPVFNEKGEVVAVHFAGTDTTSFEMRVEYLRDALAQLLKKGRVRRGELGVDLDTMLVADAIKHFRLPRDYADKVYDLREDIKRLAHVEYVAPDTPAYGKLQAGDLVLKVDGEWFGDDVYRFDRIVDGKVGGKVSVTIVRGGKTLEFGLRVKDAEKTKALSFVLFAGGVLQDVTPEQRLNYNISAEGVFLTQAEKGSSFAGLGREGSHTKYLLMLEGVNGVPTPDLKSFIEAVESFRDSDHIYVLIQDRWRTQSITQARPVRLDLKYFPLRVFEWSPKTLEWAERKG